MLILATFLCAAAAVHAAWSEASLEKHVDVLELAAPFVPVVGAEWFGTPHHHRTPFAVSPDGKSAYLAYLEGNHFVAGAKMCVHVQKLSTETFKAEGAAVAVDGAIEASGLVAHNDGFALFTHFNTTTTTTSEYHIPHIVRYKASKQAWRTPVGGTTILQFDAHMRANKGNLDGDLAFNENSTYAAYYRTEYYGGAPAGAAGHGGDITAYVDANGALIASPYAAQQFCGHNFGIALAPSRDIPFPSPASGAWDYPAIGAQRTPEMFTAEAFGGTRGSYSVLARLGVTELYLVAWIARPEGKGEDALRHVQVTPLKSKKEVGGAGPMDVTLAKADTDCFNAHVAAFGDAGALVTWEEATVKGEASAYTGTRFQVVDAAGKAQGAPFVSEDVFVAGDIRKVGEKLCWPYVQMKWDSDKKATAAYGPYGSDTWDPFGTAKLADTPATTVKKMSFACVKAEGAGAKRRRGRFERRHML
ncbi:hypothetical protein BDV95DRAFT_601630 [Massariosphaeria phaeospora]|uniref:Uncharacterized protein n=1 Tax=Massariosphaeria phaeospora TaxID=100035 RepID=A0A7C8MIJ4_9PLEO|nr:hypothetical protein BDV95DRAFT_601630 [Massariosphaeria phaeospora]